MSTLRPINMNDKYKDINPLFSVQREISGAVTFEKYAYQYHWALSRIIQEHNQEKEYAVFVELHEDVVFSNSLDANKAKFEFSQVKTLDKVLDSKKLTALKNGKSILGKLITSIKDKGISDNISELNLVSVKGFNLPLKTEGLTLKKICLNDIKLEIVREITKAITNETKETALPTSLNFIVPDLPGKRFQDVIIAEIAQLINLLFPIAHCNAVEVYRALYDELTRKGMIAYDIKQWDELLRKKALTSTTVSKVINQFTQIKDVAFLHEQFNLIAGELGLNTLKSRALHNDFNRYRQQKIGNRSTIQIDITKSITAIIQIQLIEGITEISEMINRVILDLPDKLKNTFKSESELKAAIICEYIMNNYE